MEVTQSRRVFMFNDIELTDPNADYTAEQVKDFYSDQYPELINANIKGPEIKSDKILYTFGVEVGKKG